MLFSEHSIQCVHVRPFPKDHFTDHFYHFSIAVHYYLYFLHTLPCNTMSSTSWTNTACKWSDLFYHSSITVHHYSFIPFHVTPCPPPPGQIQAVSSLIFYIILILSIIMCIFFILFHVTPCPPPPRLTQPVSNLILG